MKRKVCYITGTRADFGLMKKTLQMIDEDQDLNLEVIVTGMHLLADYGYTIQEIEDAGLNIISKVKVGLTGESGSEMSISLGKQLIGITRALTESNPDLVLLLGDRGEMLAGAIAALHLNIPTVHIHGGELSGTIDESVRHSISKMSHYHFTATKKSKERLVKMGEIEDNIFVVGAPGLDQIKDAQMIPRDILVEQYGVNRHEPFILVLFHPVIQEVSDLIVQFTVVMESLLLHKIQILALMPNADAGGSLISSLLSKYHDEKRIHIAGHLRRLDYLSLVAEALVLAGNSSSGIIEAASLGTPVVNIGSRQNLRERSNNVIDVSIEKSDIFDGIAMAMSLNNTDFKNVYGDGNSAKRIVNLLKEVDLNKKVLDKINAY